ncbi:hypothetical protein BGZ46_009419 [Entomortierella lignicola]|nr:hypothetical protein BGZ46_009419 [Entomortierella lignicola]
MTGKEWTAPAKHQHTSPPASSKRGYHSQSREFVKKSASTFVDNHIKPNVHIRFSDSKSETDGYKGRQDHSISKSNSSSDSDSHFLTTSNTYPPKHKDRYKEDKETLERSDTKKSSSSTKDGSTHDRGKYKPMLTTVNQLQPRKKDRYLSDKSIDIQQLEQPHHTHQRQYESNRSPSRLPSEDRKRLTSTFKKPSKSPLKNPPSSPIKNSHNKPSTSASPLRRTKGIPIDMPSVSASDTETISPPSASTSTPSTPLKSSIGKSMTSPKRDCKSPSKRRIESVNSIPKLPETEEEYETMEYCTRVRLGDETHVRRDIRNNQSSTGNSDYSQRQKPERSYKLTEVSQAQFTKTKEGPSEPNSDSDLEDGDPFSAQPLGVQASKSSSVSAKVPPLQSTSHATAATSLETKRNYSDSTSSKSHGSNKARPPSSTEAFTSDDEGAGSSDFRHPDRHYRVRGGDVSAKDKSHHSATKEPLKSKPMVTTDEAREKFKDIFPGQERYIGKAKSIETQTSTNQSSTANSKSTSKNGQERPKPSEQSKDFFSLSKGSKQSAIIKTTDCDEDNIKKGGGTKKNHFISRSKKRSPSPSSSSEAELLELPELAFLNSPEKTRSSAENSLEHTTPSKSSNREDGLEVRTPRSGGFQLPSPRKKKPRMATLSDLMFLSDDDMPKPVDTDNVCPYCGDTLPKMTPRLANALAKVRASLKEKQDPPKPQPDCVIIDLEKDGDAISRNVLDNKPFVVPRGAVKSQPRPRRLNKPKSSLDVDTKTSNNENKSDSEEIEDLVSPTASSGRISLMDKFEFCRIHYAEEIIVPKGLKNDYPVTIDFGKLESRVLKMEHKLKMIIDRVEPSMFLDQALSRYKSMGTLGARHPHVLLANVEHTMPGYYGSKGSAELTRILVKLFLETNILTHETAYPQKPIEYIQHVLVPEAGLRLIVEDRSELHRFRKGEDIEDISLEDARRIMSDSVEYGNYMYDIHNF